MVACRKDYFRQKTQQTPTAIHGRRFFKVKSDEISRVARGNYTTLVGTHKLHTVQSCESNGQLKVRHLRHKLCYCLYTGADFVTFWAVLFGLCRNHSVLHHIRALF